MDEKTRLTGIGFTYLRAKPTKAAGKPGAGRGSTAACELRQGSARSPRSRYALTGDQSRPGYTSGCQEKQFPKGVHISPTNDEENMRARLVRASSSTARRVRLAVYIVVGRHLLDRMFPGYVVGQCG